jgi:hypothetical protein
MRQNNARSNSFIFIEYKKTHMNQKIKKSNIKKHKIKKTLLIQQHALAVTIKIVEEKTHLFVQKSHWSMSVF